ncbi:MAG: hypothetical protein ABSD85_06115, partial [Acidimicrobiales bacterium]
SQPASTLGELIETSSNRTDGRPDSDARPVLPDATDSCNSLFKLWSDGAKSLAGCRPKILEG